MNDRFTELKNIVEQSSQIIGYQLQSIESNLLTAFISMIVSALLSTTLGFLIYWIPASFLLMWTILMNSLFRSFIPQMRKGERSEDVHKVENIGLLSSATLFLLTARFKHASPLFKSIGIIFLATLISLVGYRLGVIEEDATFSIVLPIISSLLFMTLPILNNSAIGALEKWQGELDFTKIGYLGWLTIAIYVLLYVFALLVFPIWSFIVIHPIYIGEPIRLLAILVVVFLQVITALTFMNYFSASSARKELTIALFNLSNILNRINRLSFSQSFSDEIYQELSRDYIKAKRYEMSADDTLLVNFYNIIPNPAYLSSLSESNNHCTKGEK